MNLFENLTDLNAEYLDAAYGDDAETAAMIFGQYLEELPTNLSHLQQSYGNKDVERFQHYLHKQKPAYSYVGLTDVSEKFGELQVKCQTREDLETYRGEIDAVLRRIRASETLLRQMLTRLQAA